MIRRTSTPGLTAALATIAALTACSADTDTQASPGEDPAASTPSKAAPSPTDWTPLDVDGDDGILPPGRYGLTAAGLPDMPWAVVETPEGFSNFRGFTLFDEDPRGGGGVGYWTVYAVYRDPCDVDVVEVDTAEEAAAAFRSQRRSGVSATSPVTIDGYEGVYLELQAPQDVDFAECGEYMLWDMDSLGGGRYFEGPGQADRLWILDVESTVVILNAIDGPDVPEPAREQLTAMVESADLIRWP